MQLCNKYYNATYSGLDIIAVIVLFLSFAASCTRTLLAYMIETNTKI